MWRCRCWRAARPASRRGPGEPGERGGAERGALQPESRAHARLRVRQRQVLMGSERRSNDHQRCESASPRLTRRVTRCSRTASARGSDPQGHHHPRAWPSASRSSCRPTRSHNYSREYLNDQIANPARRPYRRGIHDGQPHDRRRQRPRGATELSRKMVCEWA